MNELERFQSEVSERIESYHKDDAFRKLALEWTKESLLRKYVYNFSWLGRPIIQAPQDVLAIQEIIWRTRPDLIIETGIAHGGSLILSASILELIGSASGHVVGVDIDIRRHNREAIEDHPLSRRITLIEGSSVDPDIIGQVAAIASGYDRVMVVLDSNHTHEHVLAELQGYAPLVSAGCYLVVFDTFVEDMPPGFFSDRPWDVGNNPKTAVHEFLKGNADFVIDNEAEDRLMITSAPNGFLRRL
jgi:cephalosporin hydroxylase